MPRSPANDPRLELDGHDACDPVRTNLTPSNGLMALAVLLHLVALGGLVALLYWLWR